MAGFSLGFPPRFEKAGWPSWRRTFHSDLFRGSDDPDPASRRIHVRPPSRLSSGEPSSRGAVRHRLQGVALFVASAGETGRSPAQVERDACRRHETDLAGSSPGAPIGRWRSMGCGVIRERRCLHKRLRPRLGPCAVGTPGGRANRQAGDWGLTSSDVRIKKPPATGHRPPATGHRPPATGHRPPATGHRPPATGHRPPATGAKCTRPGRNSACSTAAGSRRPDTLAGRVRAAVSHCSCLFRRCRSGCSR